jgi:hypothetical protein
MKDREEPERRDMEERASWYGFDEPSILVA